MYLLYLYKYPFFLYPNHILCQIEMLRNAQKEQVNVKKMGVSSTVCRKKQNSNTHSGTQSAHFILLIKSGKWKNQLIYVWRIISF